MGGGSSEPRKSVAVATAVLLVLGARLLSMVTLYLRGGVEEAC